MKAGGLAAVEAAFLSLHSTFTHEPELVAMRALGTPLATVLHLYPVEPLTYLPYFRQRFATRAKQKRHPDWLLSGLTNPYTWELQEMLNECTPESARVSKRDPLPAVIEELVENHVAVHGGLMGWDRENLHFEVTDVADLMSRLAHFEPRRFQLMPRHKRSWLVQHLRDLPQQFKVYEGVEQARGYAHWGGVA